MASSLAESIGNNFLQCGICLEQYNDPRVLPCHHGFCRQCLEEYVACNKEKQTLACPLCSNVVKLSKRGVTDLPVHFLVKSLKDTVEMDKSEKRPSSNTNCTNCNVNNKAKVRCFDCKEYLCDLCHTSHKILKAMRNHRVVSIEDILAGKVDIMADERSICKEHKERHKYYCKDEKRAVCQDCIILKSCPTEHDRITIDKAAQVKFEELGGLMRKTNEIIKNFQLSVEAVNIVEKELENNSQIANDALDRVEQEYIKLVKQSVKRFKDEIDNIREERMKELNRKKTNLRSTIKDIEKTNDDVTRVMQSQYKTDVISSHATLFKKLRTLSKYQPHKVDKKLGNVKFVAAIPSLPPNMGQLLKDIPERSWELIGNFRTDDFDDLHGLAVDQDNDIVVCSWDKGVKVFTRNGEVKSTLYDSKGSIDVGVLPGKKYASAPHDINGIMICDSQGLHAIVFHTTNVNNVSSDVNSLTVDSDNEIIVGQVTNTISIHATNGSLISKFSTQSRPYRVAATFDGYIVSSFYDDELKHGTSVQLMDYSGGNVRVIQPPDEVKVWSPGFVCCGQGEIFVSNEVPGDPPGVYRFTSEGDYLGCVTTQVRSPHGIALSRDGRELYVADYSNADHVKIFQRP